MNVAELIAELSKFPPEMPVWFSAEAGQVGAEVTGMDEGDEWHIDLDDPWRETHPQRPQRVVWLDGGI